MTTSAHPSAPKGKTVMIIAGEASGDIHGARVVRAMKMKRPDIRFFGVGGRSLRQAGAHLLIDAARISVVGITEVFGKLPDLLEGVRAARRFLYRKKPDLLILIDFPDFNLYLAGIAKKAGIRVLYYISPQIWAWRSGRIRTIRKRVDHMAVILPFEAEFYRHGGVPVTFVGHPLLDGHDPAPLDAAPKRTGAPWVIGLLPGSRDREIQRLLPVMAAAAEMIRKKLGRVEILISAAPSADPEFVEQMARSGAKHLEFKVIADDARAVLAASDLSVAASGTVTLEAALHGAPMIIVYKVSPLSYRLGKALIRVKRISLVNLISGREIVPELIQDDASAENIAGTALDLLSDPARLRRMRQDLLGIRDALGGKGASDRVSDIALRMLDAH